MFHLTNLRLIVRLILGLLLTDVSGAWAGTLARFQTTFGNIEVELFDADKPVTVQNFLRYTTSGAYSNMFFHRWEPGFVVQGGGYYSDKVANIWATPSFGNITNEFNVGRRFSNTYGTIAMARIGGLTNSSNSQWLSEKIPLFFWITDKKLL